MMPVYRECWYMVARLGLIKAEDLARSEEGFERMMVRRMCGNVFKR